MSRISAFARIVRLPFLILTPACVAVGVALGVWQWGAVSPVRLALVLLGALFAHVGVNAFNEYQDFKSGLDLKTRRTPFSGGSGALPEYPALAPLALKTALIALSITAAIGLYLSATVGLGLLPIGLVGLFIIVTYTRWLNRRPWLCLLAPGTGFGLLMVMGSYYAVTGAYAWPAFNASLAPFFLVNNLLLLNQFPDVEADHSVGRRHLPIVLGRRFCSHILGVFPALTYLSVIYGVLAGNFPKSCLLSLSTIFLAVPVYIGVRRHTDQVEQLLPYMALNVAVTIATPLLLAIGFLLG